MARVGAGHDAAGLAPFHDVGAGRAVHVQVDEAGEDGMPACGRAFDDPVDTFAEIDAAVDPAGGSEDSAAEHLVRYE